MKQLLLMGGYELESLVSGGFVWDMGRSSECKTCFGSEITKQYTLVLSKCLIFFAKIIYTVVWTSLHLVTLNMANITVIIANAWPYLCW